MHKPFSSPLLFCTAFMLLTSSCAKHGRGHTSLLQNEAIINQSNLCRNGAFEGAEVILCTVNPKHYQIQLAYKDKQRQPFGSVRNFITAQRSTAPPLMAMNAGMYHRDLTPVGLLVTNGQQIAPISTQRGLGNFYLKLNGVFYIDAQGKAGVMETKQFINAQRHATAPLKVQFATQSGPMLVVNGTIHPKILPNGNSKYIRNGVGVRKDGIVVFAITRDAVSFGAFARLFQAEKCPNALFFDGNVSSLAINRRMVIDSNAKAGAIVVVTPNFSTAKN